MTTKLLSKASGNPDLDAVFDPYEQGTSPPATGLTVPGYGDINVRYAPISYGSAAAATGFLTEQAGNADINTLFAAFGTAVYGLPINGNTYSASVIIPAAASGAIDIQFGLTSTSAWSIVVTRVNGTGLPPAGTVTSGSVPVGSSYVRYALTWLNASGDSGPASSTTNTASTATSLASGLHASIHNTGTGSGAPKQSTYNLKIEFLNASSVVFSTTNITLIAITEGTA